MESWDDALDSLRGEYVLGARAKVAEAMQLLSHLAGDNGDRQALSDLMRRFHAFAGSGTTYGFPQVSELGLAGERECNALILEGTSATPPHLERFRGLVSSIASLLEEEAAPQAAPSAARARPEVAARDILVVDDDASVLEGVRQLLDREGLAARCARSKSEALAEIAKRMPDGMIVDILLPDGSGYDVVSHVRSLPGGDAPGIVILSVRSGFLDKVEAIHCGADGFFEKPLDWEKLIRRLMHLLDRQRGEAARILSVEDDPSQGAFIKAVLESAGYEARVCDDPRRFESDLAAFRPDLVLMDILLPGMSGYDLVKYLRQDERHATLPIIFLTTEGQIETQMATMKTGADDHLVKPVPPGLLLSAVAGRLERARFLKGLLNRDGLTRLLTHTAFLESARAVVARKSRDPQRALAWVMFDLDHFKSINDGYGHPVGDTVIAGLSSLLRRRLRQTDTLGRYGGEEFAAVLDDLKADEAKRLVNRLLAEFRAIAFHTPDGPTFHVTFSAGIAMLEPGMTLETWRQGADDALYAAKQAGRNQVKLAS